MDRLAEAKEVNAEVIKRLMPVDNSAPARSSLPWLFQMVLAYEPEVVSAALGKLGERLRDFLESVDIDHPDLGNAFEGVFTEELQVECRELLQLAAYARSEKLHILPNIWKIFSKEISKDVLRKLEAPEINRLHVRFIKDREVRDSIRASKRMQIIDLRTVTKKGDEIWQAQPSSLRNFVRFDMAYQDELAKVEKKAKRYMDLGCTGLYGEIMKTVEAFRQQIQESYYGFNRITMTGAAVILAKSLNYSLHQPFLMAEFTTKREYRIVVERNFFQDYWFDLADPMDSVPIITGTGSAVYHRHRSDPLAYEPRLYPLHEWRHEAPLEVACIFNQLENFYEAGGKPIFDHFMIVVPGVRYPSEAAPGFRDMTGKTVMFPSVEDAKRAFDIALTQAGFFCPILVGEKDGKCYFICYWK
jgi:hypothetical protein